MRFALFYHSLISDWNHGNAHFLRGVAVDLVNRGHAVQVYEPQDGWSLTNLVKDHGEQPIKDFSQAYPELTSRYYDPDTLDLATELANVDAVLVHEWNPPELIRAIGEHRQLHGGYRLLFHDTHHRAIMRPQDIAALDLSGYDGVLAFGNLIRDVYLREGWAKRAWTWHEAADIRRFKPIPAEAKEGDLVWIGNWGDEERTADLTEFLLEPVRNLGLKTDAYGVRYPPAGREQLAHAGIEYRGWLPNFQVPQVFARHRVTVHIPRRPYRELIHGIPTIRVFEALACGIPLVSVQWNDAENLFHPGKDYLVAETGEEMAGHLQFLLDNPQEAARIAERGRETILNRHTCGHRVEEFLEIVRILKIDSQRSPQASPARMTGVMK